MSFNDSKNLNDVDLSFVSGGMPNPECFKMSKEDISPDQLKDEHFMHWWRIFNGEATEEDKRIEKEKSEKGIVG